MASLEDLPAPLPLYIMKELADLKSLDSLRRSCPLFHTLFRQHSVEIFEHLVRRTLLQEAAIELRAYVLLTQSPPNSLQSEQDYEGLYRQAVRPLAAKTPVTAVSYALREFSFVASACDAILRRKLSRLYALPHEHLKDKLFDSNVDHSRPDGISYAVPDPSPPDWQEQQRSIRAAFRLRVASKLRGEARVLATCGFSTEGAFPTDGRRPQWLADEMEDVSIEQLKLQSNGLVTDDHTSPMSWNALADVPPLHAKASVLAKAWQQTLEWSSRRASQQSTGFHWFHAVPNIRRYSVLYKADWKVLRGLGLGIWSDRRLAEELHLKNYPRAIKPPSDGQAYRVGVDDFLSSSDMLFTWEKLYLAALAANEDGCAVT